MIVSDIVDRNKITISILFFIIVLFAPNLVTTPLANIWPVLCIVLIISAIFLVKKYYYNSVLLIVPFLVFVIITLFNAIKLNESDFLLFTKEVFRSVLYVSVILFFSTFSLEEKSCFFKSLCKLISFFSLFSFFLYLLVIYSPSVEYFIFNAYYNVAGAAENIAYSRSRVSLTIGNPNAFAFCLSNLFFIYLVKTENKNYLYYIVMLIIVGFISISFSRTGYISFLLCLIFYIAFFYKNSIRSIFLISLICIIVFFLFQGFLDDLLERVSYTSLGGREDLWIEAMRSSSFKSNYITGLTIIPNDMYIDNDYITILYKYGFIGFFFYILTLFIIFILTVYKGIRFLKTDSEIKNNIFVFSTALINLLVFSIAASVLTSYKMSLILLPILSLLNFSKLSRRKV